MHMSVVPAKLTYHELTPHRRVRRGKPITGGRHRLANITGIDRTLSRICCCAEITPLFRSRFHQQP